MISWEQWEFDLLEFHINSTLYEKTNLEPFFRQISDTLEVLVKHK